MLRRRKDTKGDGHWSDGKAGGLDETAEDTARSRPTRGCLACVGRTVSPGVSRGDGQDKTRDGRRGRNRMGSCLVRRPVLPVVHERTAVLGVLAGNLKVVMERREVTQPSP